MAATYTEVSLEEMEKFLKRAFRVLRPKKNTERGEVYYDLSLSPHVVVRVWTSIMASGSAAGVGSDAIRIQLMSSKTKKPLMKGKAPIVKRTQGWKTNLQERIEDAIEAYEDKDDYWESRANPGAAPSHEEKDDRDTDLDDREKEEEKKAPVLDQPTPAPTRIRSPIEAQGTFTRLRNGDWGLRVEGAVEPGDKVKTVRRDGKVQWLVVQEVVWRGQAPNGGPLTLTTFIQGGRTASEDLDEWQPE